MKKYTKYLWFYTSSGKLVIGGKNSNQNELLLQQLTEQSKDYILMHTREPGSPFCVIFSDPSKVSPSDESQCASFTACFSQAWKSGKKKALVDIFRTSQLYKTEGMKQGTWGVKQPIKNISV